MKPSCIKASSKVAGAQTISPGSHAKASQAAVEPTVQNRHSLSAAAARQDGPGLRLQSNQGSALGTLSQRETLQVKL